MRMSHNPADIPLITDFNSQIYGRRLTALVLSSKGPRESEEDTVEANSIHIRFGEKASRIKARVVRVRCPKPES